MRKLVTYISLCLIAVLLLPACKSKLGITKRHYLKGYHVSHSKPTHNTIVVKAKERIIEAERIETVRGLHIASQSNCANAAEVNPVQNLVASSASYKMHFTSKPAYKDISVNSPAKDWNKITSKLGSGDHEGHGHSLFWIVIMVILILWLLGFLLGGIGLGGLIHILLVIALILFILWLLRVV
jgi:hypothetical protein